MAAQRRRGFTLIEALFVVLIIAVAAAFAVPSFVKQMRKAKRGEAKVALHGLLQAQEKFRANCPQYAAGLSTTDSCAGGSSSISYAAASETGLYTVAISAASDTGFSATATAQGKQVEDAQCATMTLTLAAGNVTSGPAECW